MDADTESLMERRREKDGNTHAEGRREEWPSDVKRGCWRVKERE